LAGGGGKKKGGAFLPAKRNVKEARKLNIKGVGRQKVKERGGKKKQIPREPVSQHRRGETDP